MISIQDKQSSMNCSNKNCSNKTMGVFNVGDNDVWTVVGYITMFKKGEKFSAIYCLLDNGKELRKLSAHRIINAIHKTDLKGRDIRVKVLGVTTKIGEHGPFTYKEMEITAIN